MLGETRFLAACVSATLILNVGCGPDAATGPSLKAVADRDMQSDQSGHAAGGHPEISRFIDEFDIVFAEGEFCPSFAVHIEGENRVIVRVFATHLAIKNNYKATLTNLATGFSIEDNGAWTDIVHFDEEGNEESLTTIGSIFRITIPGRGIVLQDTGIITFDSATGEVLFEGGPHEAAAGVGPSYCDLLSGN
jgi:hypothetical protein